MKTYTFEAFVKNEKSAVEFAKEFLRDLGENPKEFKIVVNAVIPTKKFLIKARKDEQ